MSDLEPAQLLTFTGQKARNWAGHIHKINAADTHGVGPRHTSAPHQADAALSVPEWVNQLRPIFEIFFQATPLLTLIQAAAAADDVPCETVIGSLREPSDFAGLPVVTDDGVRLEPPAWAKRLHAAQAGYLFLDELSTSPPAVQSAMLGVALERRVGDLLLPRAVQVVAAANPPERAADGWDLTPPLANRFLHVSYTPAVDGWIDGMTAGFLLPAGGRVSQPNRERTAVARASVAAFIRCRPALLDACPTNPTASGRAWPSRRTWTMTADVLALLADDDAEAAYLAACGLVGEGAAVEYLTWRREADLPDPALVLADPTSVAWRSLDPSRTWAILAGVVGYSTGRGTIDAWRAGWGPLAVAAEMGKGDVAAACARTLLMARPPNARPPHEVRAFIGVLSDAGLMSAA